MSSFDQLFTDRQAPCIMMMRRAAPQNTRFLLGADRVTFSSRYDGRRRNLFRSSWTPPPADAAPAARSATRDAAWSLAVHQALRRLLALSRSIRHPLKSLGCSARPPRSEAAAAAQPAPAGVLQPAFGRCRYADTGPPAIARGIRRRRCRSKETPCNFSKAAPAKSSFCEYQQHSSRSWTCERIKRSEDF